MMRILRANPLIKVPPDLLFVGRVMGLLNGLSDDPALAHQPAGARWRACWTKTRRCARHGVAPVAIGTSRRLLEA